MNPVHGFWERYWRESQARIAARARISAGDEHVHSCQVCGVRVAQRPNGSWPRRCAEHTREWREYVREYRRKHRQPEAAA